MENPDPNTLDNARAIMLTGIIMPIKIGSHEALYLKTECNMPIALACGGTDGLNDARLRELCGKMCRVRGVFNGFRFHVIEVDLV